MSGGAGGDQGIPACNREGWKPDTAGDFQTLSLKTLAASVTPDGWSTTNKQFIKESDAQYTPSFSYDASGLIQLSDSGAGMVWKLDSWGSDGLFCLDTMSGVLTVYNNGPSSATNPIWTSTGGYVGGSGFPSSSDRPGPPLNNQSPPSPAPITTGSNGNPGNGSDNPVTALNPANTAANGNNPISPTTKGSSGTGNNPENVNVSTPSSASGPNITLIALIAGSALAAIIFAIGIVVWIKKNKRHQQRTELGLGDVREYSDDGDTTVVVGKVNTKDSKPASANASLGQASIKLVSIRNEHRDSTFKGSAFTNIMNDSLTPQANNARRSWIIQPPQDGSSAYVSDLSEPAPAYRPRPPPLVVDNVVTKVPWFYRAVHDYEAQYDQELSLVRNQHVYVTTMPDEEGWCRALVDKKEGFVYALDLATLD
ncbi:UNVERIFIED_CONTAM: hypothetical protein HDU68_003510 [Siphonaria sp. JEL0065]|nr:hypothetical protein HDU68_003510 [Siphonaria sp. JEL0065]